MGGIKMNQIMIGRFIAMKRKEKNLTQEQLAEKLGLSTSGVGYRIRMLKEEGRVRYRKTGGRGMWEID